MPNSFTTACGSPPLRESLDGFFNVVAAARHRHRRPQTLERHPQRHQARKSPFSLYRTDLASFTMGRYNPKDAEGFINLFALPVTVRPKAKASSRIIMNAGVILSVAKNLSSMSKDRAFNDRTQRRPPLGRPLRTRAKRALRHVPALLLRSIAACCPTKSPSTAPGPKLSSPSASFTATEVKQTLAALDKISSRAKSDPAWLESFGANAEDVHHFVEKAISSKNSALSAGNSTPAAAATNSSPPISASSSSTPPRELEAAGQQA